MANRGPAVLAAAIAALGLCAILILVLAPANGPVPAPVPDPPPGDFELHGTVLASDGSALAGIAVRARILTPGIAHMVTAGRTDGAGRFGVRLFPPRGEWEVRALPECRPPFSAAAPVVPVPGGSGEIVLREPAAAAPAPSEPNLGGEVVDTHGRLLTGIPVLAVAPDERVLGRTVSGADGRFALRVDSPPPLCVVVAEENHRGPRYVRTRRQEHLPRLDLLLIHGRAGRERDTLYVKAVPESWSGDMPLRVRVLDSIGETEIHTARNLVDTPWCIEDVPLGVCDIRVDGEGVAGSVQGFDFRRGNSLATVRLGKAARIRAKLTRPARAFLISKSPTLAPLSVRTVQDDLIGGDIRGVWARTRQVSRVSDLSFDRLPAGDYLLRLFGYDLEILEIPISLSSGEERDLGTIEIRKGSGSVVLEIVDRDRPELEFEYLVRLYSRAGSVLRRRVGPGPEREVRFTTLAAGVWKFRVERLLSGEGHRRSVGLDRPVTVKAGEISRTVVDCRWRFDF